MNYFNDCKTAEALKKAFKRWVVKLHPDNGGIEEDFKKMSNGYDKYFEKLKNVHVNAKGEEYQKETQETPEEFKELIEKLFKMDGVEIEIIGSFVWVSGDTKKHKDGLEGSFFVPVKKNRTKKSKIVFIKYTDNY